MGKEIGVFVAWPYANGDLHLGHIAGAYLPADLFARYHRLRGNRVLMASGSDAHGTPITLKAKDENTTPIEVVKRYHRRFLEAWKAMGISFDVFTHTHTPNHIETTQDFFRTLHSRGDLSVKTQQQFYDETAAMFLPDRYVGGTCPLCGYARARGDQCENCGKTFGAAELVNPVSLISSTPPAIKDTDHYFFEIGRYAEPLSRYIESKRYWRSHVQNFTKAMLEEGLKARPITRDIDWGVPVPEAGWESKVIYVWFDAVIGYFSASKEWSRHSGDPQAWERWWKNPESRSYYFIGKDNIPFHSVIWPIELMAYDSELNLPYDVPANQFLNIAGEKLSTSRGLAVWLLDVLGEYDADALRYYLTSILPESKDSNFYWDEFITRNNGELVAAWGNLVNRVFGFAFSRYDAKVPQPQQFDSRDNELLAAIDSTFAAVSSAYEEVRLRDALREAMAFAREVNRYLDEKAPWTVFKQDQAAAGTATFVAMKAIDSLKVLLAPVLPHTCAQIHEMLGGTEPLFGEQRIIERPENGEISEVLVYQLSAAEASGEDRFKPSALAPGTPFSKPFPLYKVLEPRPTAGAGDQE